MPTYEDLRSYFEETAALRRVADNAARIPIVLGFVLDVDPLWRMLYDIEFGLTDWVPDPWWEDDLRYLLYDLPRYATSQRRLEPADRGFRRRNLFATIPRWKDLAGQYQGTTKRERLPITMTIVHRPLRPTPPKSDGTPFDDMENLRRLVQIVREGGVAVRIEERPQARLALAHGDNIVAAGTRSGTLGGVLEDKASNKIYGVTCAHVAKANDMVVDSAGSQVGICTADSVRVSLASPQVCDPINLSRPAPYPGNGPQVNMLDGALIEMSSPVVRRSIAGVAGALSPGQSVVMVGAVTKATRHWLGSLCISYAFMDAGQSYCFRDAIELVPQPSGLLGRAVVPTQGDSGGWVMTDMQPPDWAAVFFGEDGRRGFAIRAKWIHDWAERQTGSALTL